MHMVSLRFSRFNHDNVPWQIEKGTDPSSTHKALSYGEKIAKIGPVYEPEIFE